MAGGLLMIMAAVLLRKSLKMFRAKLLVGDSLADSLMSETNASFVSMMMVLAPRALACSIISAAPPGPPTLRGVWALLLTSVWNG